MASLKYDTLGHIVSTLLEEDFYFFDTFIESGTLTGNTTLEMSNYFQRVHTVELSEYYFNEFQKVLGNNNETITSHLGDSSKVVPDILKTLTNKNNCIFFLDGHWSSGDTGRGEKDCPLIEECLGIDKNYKAEKGIIIIDDYRLFGTKINEDWLEITKESILKTFNKFKVTNETVYGDMYILLIENDKNTK